MKNPENRKRASNNNKMIARATRAWLNDPYMQAGAGFDSSVKAKFVGWKINEFFQRAEPVYVLDAGTDRERRVAVHYNNVVGIDRSSVVTTPVHADDLILAPRPVSGINRLIASFIFGIDDQK